MSLPESLERAAATDLADLAEQIRPANGDAHKLLEQLQPDQAGEILAWILIHAPENASELVDAWGEYEEGAEILLGATEEGLSKAARKVLRKARHRIRSRGIEVPALPKPQPRTKRIGSDEDAFEAATISTPDFRGGRVAYLADRHPAGGARLFEIRFDEARGIRDFKVYNAGRSKVRGFLHSLQSEQSQRLFDVPRAALCALVRRASLAQPAERPLPSGFVEWRGRLFSASLEKELTPGGLVRKALSDRVDTRDAQPAIDAVVAAVAQGAAGPWPPATTWVGERMERGRESVEGLAGEARATAIDAWRESAARDLQSASDADLMRRHLEELAWIRWRAEDEEFACDLLVCANALSASGDEEVGLRIAGARVDALFEPFLAELRVVEEDALADSTGEST